MNKQEKQSIFNYVRENVNSDFKIDSSVDHIIDFKNGSCFSIYDIDDLYDIYWQIDKQVSDYIYENVLDSVEDYFQIVSNFERYKDYFMASQGYIIDFKDYVLKLVIELAKIENILVPSNIGNGTDEIEIKAFKELKQWENGVSITYASGDESFMFGMKIKD